ncbi:tumor necrosis factor alpha-induced protein 2-like [Leptodactylus fuscus]
MTNALAEAEKCWHKGSVNSSELSADILQIYTSGIKSAVEISEDFINKITPVLVNEFLEFLKRYKRSIENYYKKNKAIPQFKEIIIANMNYCSHFRDFIEHANAGEDAKQKIYSILNEIENQGFGILLQDLFEGIKSHFRGISRTKGLNNQEIMSHIITTANTYISSVTTLTDRCRQVMAGKIHTNLVKEYLTEMKEIRQCNTQQQRDLAAQMENIADLFNQFCTDHLNDAQMSEAKWRNDAIRKIADIIQLQDLDAIKLVVGVLAHEYPDIRKRHVKAILYIKNNLKTAERMSVVKIMENITKTTDHPQRQLFASIPCMPCCCLLF